MHENDMKNAEGYKDTTAYEALQNIDSEKRAATLIRVLRYIVKNSGFELIEHIKLRDKSTGREYH